MTIIKNYIEVDGKYEKQVFTYRTAHVGVVNLAVKEGQRVIEGEILYAITRLGLEKPKNSLKDGVVNNISFGLEGKFTGFDEHVLTLEHVLSEEEKRILEEERHFNFILADIGAKYYLTLYKGSEPLVREGSIIQSGDTIALSMVQKKKMEIEYTGPRAEVKRIYFGNGDELKEGERLFGLVKSDGD